MSEVQFPAGLTAKAPHENAPDFFKAKIVIHVKDLGNWLREKNKAGEEWVSLDVKESKGGKWYASVDEWKPDPNRQAPQDSAGSDRNNTDPAPDDGDFDPDSDSPF